METNPKPGAISLPRRPRHTATQMLTVDGRSIAVTVKSPKKLDAKKYGKWREKKEAEIGRGENVIESKKTTNPQKQMRVDMCNLKKTVRPVHEKSLLEQNSPVRKKAVALDCKLIESTSGEKMIGRVIVVDEESQVLLDTVVCPIDPVLDYCTQFSGITEESMLTAKDLKNIQNLLSPMLKDKFVVGYRVRKRLNTLGVRGVPDQSIREISTCENIRHACSSSGYVPLEMAVKMVFKERGFRRKGQDDVINDALQCLRLYTHFKDEWRS